MYRALHFHIGKFPATTCTFEQPEVCGPELFQQLACPASVGDLFSNSRTAVTNGEILSRSKTWITTDRSYGNHTGKGIHSYS